MYYKYPWSNLLCKFDRFDQIPLNLIDLVEKDVAKLFCIFSKEILKDRYNYEIIGQYKDLIADNLTCTYKSSKYGNLFKPHKDFLYSTWETIPHAIWTEYTEIYPIIHKFIVFPIESFYLRPITYTIDYKIKNLRDAFINS